MFGRRTPSSNTSPSDSLPSSKIAILWAGLSLFLSGTACLMAQVIIQKYLSVLFGGVAAPIMYLISFSFIAGLGAGSLISGTYAARLPTIKWGWSAVDFSCFV